MKETYYIGTFHESGLHVLAFDRARAAFEPVTAIADVPAPSFQALHPSLPVLYSVSAAGMTKNDANGTVAVCPLDHRSGSPGNNSVHSSYGSEPCHVSVDPKGSFVYVSNYGSGNLAVYPIIHDGGLGEICMVIRHEGKSAHATRQEGPHMHSAAPSHDGRFVYASDLGIDQIRIYAVDREAAALKPADTPFVASAPGSGPRHLAIHPNGAFAYSAEELSSTVAVYGVDAGTGALTPVQRVSMLPEGFEGENSAADIHLSPDGRFLYASNRGHDSIVIYVIHPKTGRLTTVGHEPTRGGHPRNFHLDNRGEYLFAANRDGDNVVVFERNSSTGKLRATGAQTHVPKPVCITPFLRDAQPTGLPR